MASNNNSSGLGAVFDNNSSQKYSGMSLKAFLASLVTAIIIFAVEVGLFILLKAKLTRIYQPRTFLVPNRERIKPSPPGFLGWIIATFKTSNAEFIRKCGLDAYFFLRYLRMLLKIFVPLAMLIMPTLIPLNVVGGKNTGVDQFSNNHTSWNVTGLDQLAWGNVAPNNTDRYWAHLVLAVVTIIYVCFIFFDELRGYIRLRQAYLTSPQHRLRASATTVLVTAIPLKWLSVQALDNLYDVFPGGIRNIWLNRNLDELNDKIKLRNKLALALESAETELIKKCKKVHMKRVKKEMKKSGKSSKEQEQAVIQANERASKMAMGAGISSGNPHEIEQTAVREGLCKGHVSSTDGSSDINYSKDQKMVGNSLTAVGRGVGKTMDDRRRSTSQSDKIAYGLGGAYDFAKIRGEDSYPAAGLNGDSGSAIIERTRPPSNGLKVIRSHPTGKRKKQPADSDEIPLTGPSPTDTQQPVTQERLPPRKCIDETRNEQHPSGAAGGESYPIAYNEKWENEVREPLWKQYIKEKDRDTMRLPIFGWTWMPSLPLIGKKVDTIDYCRKEVARLNLEIEMDQRNPERFPLMNSAFIQFNHQVAAHMACQSLSHHIPKQMAPRIVEISPDDVIWDNMSMRWWERYLRTTGVLMIICAMVIGWAFPVAFTGVLSQLSSLETKFSWLSWLSRLPEWLFSAIQGVLPPLFLAILTSLLPFILRFLSKTQGNPTGMGVELSVSNYYFAFLFVQLFLVVSISSSFSNLFDTVANVTSWPELLAQNIPKSSNYFFSYMVLQAMSVSAGALVQIGGLLSWFILAPIFDNTARSKWNRTVGLNEIQWGTFFPVYTVLACIGLIYCVIAPFILIFNVVTFGLFWFVYRYNILYVTKFRFDTGGLLFPKAINQLFTGLYIMELALIGLFFLVRDTDGNASCKGQAIVMIVVLILTAGYQYFVDEAFSPLYRYLPITLEDDAVLRDQEFERMEQQRRKDFQAEAETNDQNIEARLKDQERRDVETVKSIELSRLESSIDISHQTDLLSKSDNTAGRVGMKIVGGRHSWANRSENRHSKSFGGSNSTGATATSIQLTRTKFGLDPERQGNVHSDKIGDALFSGISDELEYLTPDERDQLVQRAFTHEALRAKRPVIWIPRDDIGVSDDEIYRTHKYSKHIWISNEYVALDAKRRCIFGRSPPDFSEIDVIQL